MHFSRKGRPYSSRDRWKRRVRVVGRSLLHSSSAKRLKLAGFVSLVAVLLLVRSPERAVGQAVTATLLGTVTDSTGAAVPGAKVTIKEVNTAVSRSQETNTSGYYVFSQLTPGAYDVTVEKIGFTSQVQQAVAVLVNTTVRVDAQLHPGALKQEVTVTAEAALLMTTDRADTGRKIETKQISQLPIIYNNYNFQGLVNLVPGTTRAFRPHSEFFNPQDSLSTQVNGNSRLANNLQFEGVDDNERTGLLQVLVPPTEAIETVDVTTSNYDAELGRAGGAVTNVALKSGTNSLHGAAYAFNHVKRLQARSFFDRGPGGQPFMKPNTVYNYDGANIGGPIKKDKAFFFFDYLHINDNRGKTEQFTLPTLALRNGDFTGTGVNIFDPKSGKPDGSGRTQFVASSNPASPNFNPACASAAGCPNIIPSNRIDPIAAKLQALVPPPNLAGAGFSQNFTENFNFVKITNSFDGKVDFVPTASDHVSGRVSYEKPLTTDPPAFGLAGGPHSGGFQATGSQKTWNVGGSWNHIFSPTLLTEVRAGVDRYRNVANNSDAGTKASDAIGIPGVNLDTFTSGLTEIRIDDFSNPILGYSASLPWVRAETNIDVVNNWTKIKGTHTFKWGVDVRRVRDDLLQDQTFGPRGSFRFGRGQTSAPGQKANFANSFASFLLGVPRQVGRDTPGPFPAYRQTWWFIYGGDKWQVTPKLTADLGLRWELYPPATPHFAGGFSNYDPNTNSLVVAGIGDNPRNLGLNFVKNNFAPRIGLAYRLTNNTVIRAGFGISYEPFPDNTYAYNFPVRQNQAFNSLNSFGPALFPDGTPVNFAQGFPAPLPLQTPSNGIIPANTPSLLNQSFDIIPKNFQNPYVESWNFAIQRALPHNFSFEAAYVGNHSVDTATRWNVNAGFVLGAGSAGKPLFQKFGRNADSTISFIGTSSNYNALQMKFDHRSRNFLMTTAYTYSKALDITDEDGGFFDPTNFRRSYGRAGFDRTHVFVQSYVYDLPFGKGQRWLTTGWANVLLQGWQVSGVLTLMSGSPLTFGASGTDLNTPGTSQTANQVGPFRRLFGIDTKPFFDTRAFTQPVGKGVVGTSGRNILAGPSFVGLDAAAFRMITLTERFKLEFRSEWFNALNRPQFGNPSTTIGSSNFGLIKSAGGARRIDFGLKLTF